MEKLNLRKLEARVREVLSSAFQLPNRLDQNKIISDFVKVKTQFKLPPNVAKRNKQTEIFQLKLVEVISKWEAFLDYCSEITGIKLHDEKTAKNEKSLVDSLITM